MGLGEEFFLGVDCVKMGRRGVEEFDKFCGS
jgi:hypothetical protein